MDKIISVYFAGVNASPFTYKNQTFLPKPLFVSPLIFRGFTCPSGCGGCCPRFSLDYLPFEKKPYLLNCRIIQINGKEFEIYSDVQKNEKGHFCRNLEKQTGRCMIYQNRPFSCDFELIRFVHFPQKVILTQKLFSRGWAMKRVDDNRGAACDMVLPDDYSKLEVLRKLYRLEEWCDYFQISHRLRPIINWVKKGPYKKLLEIKVTR